MPELRPIGVIHSPYRTRGEAPPQGAEAGGEAVIHLDPELADGLAGLRPGRHYWVIYGFDRAGEVRLSVHPRRDPARPPTGLFNSRSPDRPNPLGLCLVELLAVAGARLTVRGLDALDQSPVWDLKPYQPALDAPRRAAGGPG